MTKKQQIFINEFLKCFNATEAARRAGYSGNDNTLGVTGAKLVRNGKVKAAIDARLAESAMSANEVLKRLGDMARGDIGDFSEVELKGGLKDHPLSHLVKRMTTEVKEDANGKVTYKAQIELYDAQSALNTLAKHHKLLTDRVEHINYDLSNCTDEQLQRIADGEHPATVMANSGKSQT